MKKKINKIVHILLAIFITSDVLLTSIGVSIYGTGIEGNRMVKYLMENIHFGFYLYFIFSLALVYLSYYLIKKYFLKKSLACDIFFTIVILLVLNTLIKRINIVYDWIVYLI